VARIRVIFDLPRQFGAIQHPLAYIHWYRPLTRLDPATNMYQIIPSTRRGRPNSEVVTVDRIWQGCVLTPVLGPGSVPLQLRAGDGLDFTSKFYLNKYLDFHLFGEYEECLDE
jgi:hypothetical protein